MHRRPTTPSLNASQKCAVAHPPPTTRGIKRESERAQEEPRWCLGPSRAALWATSGEPARHLLSVLLSALAHRIAHTCRRVVIFGCSARPPSGTRTAFSSSERFCRAHGQPVNASQGTAEDRLLCWNSLRRAAAWPGEFFTVLLFSLVAPHTAAKFSLCCVRWLRRMLCRRARLHWSRSATHSSLRGCQFPSPHASSTQTKLISHICMRVWSCVINFGRRSLADWILTPRVRLLFWIWARCQIAHSVILRGASESGLMWICVLCWFAQG